MLGILYILLQVVIYLHISYLSNEIKVHISSVPSELLRENKQVI